MKKLFSIMLLLATVLSFTACGSDNDEPDDVKLSKSSYTLYHEGTAMIQGSNLSNLSWSPDNEFVATVKNNVITANYVGKTVVKSSTKNLSFTVEVKPKYSLYKEPDLDWTATKTSIKKKYGTPYKETSSGFMYETSNSKVPYMVLLFEGEKISSYTMVCQISSAEELADFLLERYAPVQADEANLSAVFIHGYGKINNLRIDYMVGMQYNSTVKGITVSYVKYNGSKSISADDMNFGSTFKDVEKMTSNISVLR